jgi:hypothetical protein
MRKSMTALSLAVLLLAGRARADETAELRNARENRRAGMAMMLIGSTVSAAGMIVGLLGATEVGCDRHGFLFSDCQIMQYVGLGFGAAASGIAIPGIAIYAAGENQENTLRVSLAGTGARLSLTF